MDLDPTNNEADNRGDAGDRWEGWMRTCIMIKQHEIKCFRRAAMSQGSIDEMSWRRPWEIRQTLKGVLCMHHRACWLSVEIFFFFKQNKDEAFSANLTTRPHANISDKDCLIQRWNDAKCCCWSWVNTERWWRDKRPYAVQRPCSKCVTWVKEHSLSDIKGFSTPQSPRFTFLHHY